MDKENNNEIQTHVINVKTVHFDYNPIQKQSEIYDCRFNFQEFFKVEENLFRILTTVVILSDNETDLSQGSATIKVLNDYHIENIGRFVVDNKMELPEDVDKVFMSVSYSHTRALLAELLSGTYLSNVLLPIISVDRLYAAKKNQ